MRGIKTLILATLAFVGVGFVGANASAKTITEADLVDGTYTLAEDLSETLIIDGLTMTLNLNGKTLDGSISAKNGAKVTITGNGKVGDTKDGKVYAVGEGTEITIKNGTFKSTDTGNVALIHATEKAKITIEDGTFKAAPAVGDEKEGKVIYAGSNSGKDGYQDKYGYIVITGGNFAGRLSNSNWGVYTVSGGTFDRNVMAYYEVPATLTASWPKTNETTTLAEAGWLVEGYEMVALDGGGYGVKQKELKVTFDANGHGNGINSTVTYGEKATKPENPTAEGYTFGGWYTDEECTEEFDFDTLIKTDVTLYAKWTQAVLAPDTGRVTRSNDFMTADMTAAMVVVMTIALAGVSIKAVKR